ncbi:MAG: hypothetical protein PHF84_05055 [bacterium]|nr:hypothetical protein [bacterium]
MKKLSGFLYRIFDWLEIPALLLFIYVIIIIIMLLKSGNIEFIYERF